MDINLVDVIKGIISVINDDLIIEVLEITPIDSEINKVSVCDLKHLAPCNIIEDENGLKFEIKAIEGKEITLKPFGHTDLFSATQLIAKEVIFIHGSPTSINNEYQINESRTSKKTPFVWLLGNYEGDTLASDSNIVASFRTTLFFLDWANETKWSNDEHNDNVIKPMQRLVCEFIETIETDYSFKTLNQYTIKHKPRFGVIVKNNGSKDKIIDEDLSGVELNIQIELYDTSICCGK